MGKVRGIRFTDAEDKLIDEFLKKNPLFDFSMLTKISILQFIKDPKINITPIDSKNLKSKDQTHGHA